MKELRNSKREYKIDEIVDIEFDAEMAKAYYKASHSDEEDETGLNGGAVSSTPPKFGRLSSDGLRKSAKEVEERRLRREGLKRLSSDAPPSAPPPASPYPPATPYPLQNVPPPFIRSASSCI